MSALLDEMQSKIAPEIAHDPTLAAVVSAANEILLRGIGRAQHRPHAEWRLVRNDGNGPTIELTLSDSEAQVTQAFTIEALKDHAKLRYRFSDLWGDLILQGNHVITEKLSKLLRSLESAEAFQGA